MSQCQPSGLSDRPTGPQNAEERLLIVRKEGIGGMQASRQVIGSPTRMGIGPGSPECGLRTPINRPLYAAAITEPPAVAVPVGQALALEYAEAWPMQKIVTDMIDFAEELHRSLLLVPSIQQAPAIRGYLLTLAQLEAKLEMLLARSGVERDDPTGSSFDPASHQKMAEQCMSGEIPGTVIRACSSTWTMNGQLLRPAMVIVSVASPDDILKGMDPLDAVVAIE